MIVAVSDRNNSERSFFSQLECVAAGKPDYIILKESDITEKVYSMFAKQTLGICNEHSIKLCIDTFFRTAEKMKIKDVALTLELFRTYHAEVCDMNVWAYVSTEEEAEEAKKLGASRLIVTWFDGGTAYYSKVTAIAKSTGLPVMAYGEVNKCDVKGLTRAGCADMCIQGPLMGAIDPTSLIQICRDNAIL